MKSLLNYLLTLFLALWSTAASAQAIRPVHQPATTDLRFEHISIADGLSQSSVFTILQDSQGYLWFGTANGLNRYDGYAWTVYHHDPEDITSISHGFITALCEDSQNNLWVGTSSGLNRLKLGSGGVGGRSVEFTRYLADPADPGSISNGRINAIYEDGGGNVWVGTMHGLNKYDRDTNTFVHYFWEPSSASSLSHNNISTIFEDSSGFLWIGTAGGGLTKFSPSLAANNTLSGSKGFDEARKHVRYYQKWSGDLGQRYPSLLQAKLHTLLARRKPFVALAGVRDSAKISKPFEVGQKTQVVAISFGEGVQRMVDFADITHADEVIWRMHIGQTRHAGGHIKNRLQTDLLDLKPGQYVLNYQSDHSHSYSNWNQIAPDLPDFWGVQLLDVTPSEAQEFQDLVSSEAHSRPVSGNHISTIFEDPSGAIWVGTLANGLNKYDPETDSFVYYQVDDVERGVSPPRSDRVQSFPSKSIASNSITSISQDNRGDLWVGTNGGLSRFLSDERGFESFGHHPLISHSLSTNAIAALHADGSGILWIGTVLGGLSKLNIHKNQFRSYTHHPNLENSLRNKLVYAFCEDREGLIWVGTATGLSIYDPRQNRFLRQAGPLSALDALDGHWVRSLLFDSEGTIWAGTGSGLFEIAPLALSNLGEPGRRDVKHYRHNSADPMSLGADVIRTLYEDREGSVWVGAAAGGANQVVDNGPDREKSFKRLLGQNWIRAVFQDRSGTLWFGTEGDGLFRYDKSDEIFGLYQNSGSDPNSLSHNVINSLYEDDDGFLWITTYGGGLNRLNPERDHFVRFNQDQDLPNNVIYGSLPDDRGNLWLSSNKGLTRFNPRTNQFKSYDVDDGLQSNEFNTGAFYKSRSGEMYFGGVNGFTVFHPDSIQDNEFIPPVMLTNLMTFDRSIDFDALGGNPVKLSYSENYISFEFTAFDYTNPDKNQYAYMLEGLDEDWTYCGARRFASYANLAPGDYVLRVKGSNSDGVWNQSGVALPIRIVPPWWQTTWFKLGLLIGFVILAWLLYRTRIARIKSQKAELEVLVGERTSALQTKTVELEAQRRIADQAKHTIKKQADRLIELDRIKSRFFANISHEFRTPLTLILGPTEEALANGYDEKSKAIFKNVRRNAKRLLALINQLLELAKLENGKMVLELTRCDIVSFAKGVVACFEPVAQQKKIQLAFDSAVPECQFDFDLDKMEKILHNLLSNALKFTSENGKICVALACQKVDEPRPSRADDASSAARSRFFSLSVADTGIGMPQDRLSRVFDRFYQVDPSATREHEGTGIGLALTKELVELHQGTIQVESSPNNGSTFVVTLPMNLTKRTRRRLGNGSEYRMVQNQPSPADGDSIPSLYEGTGAGLSPKDRPIILIVEDHSELGKYINDCMSDTYRIIEATNGTDGFEKAIRHVPDLVISDIMMPQMDGMELCGALKADARTCHIPIILLTAKAGEQDKLDGLRTGADDYVTKPFTSAEIQVRVANLIEQRRKLHHHYSQRMLLQPDEVDEISLDDAFLRQARQITVANMEDSNFSVQELARELKVSRMQLHRKLKALTGQSGTGFIRAFRLSRAQQLLKQGCGTVSEIAFAVGFNNLSYFSKCFRTHFGYLPSEQTKLG